MRAWDPAPTPCLWTFFHWTLSSLVSTAAIHSFFLPTDIPLRSGSERESVRGVACVFSRNDRHLIVSWCWQNLSHQGEGSEKKEVVVGEWNWGSAGASVFAANLSHGVIKLHIILWLCVLDHWVQHHKKPASSLGLVVQLLHTCFKEGWW